MPTYRVHLRCTTTNPPNWDWVQIVTADDVNIATQSAYITWVKAALNTWVPRLSDCQSMTEEINGTNPADTLPLNL
jgi:hypothetical protein